MITINKPIYLSKNDEYNQFNKMSRPHSKVVLLNEEIFIKIIKLKGKYKLHDILDENVQSTFSDHDMLIHYEILKTKKEKFLIIYFVNYYGALKSIVNKCKNIRITPYQLQLKRGKFFRGISVIVSKFNESIYLVIKINGVVVHTKNILAGNIEEAIKSSLESLKNNFKTNELKYKLYNDKNIVQDLSGEIFTRAITVGEGVN